LDLTGSYHPCGNTYDYDAPLTEASDITDKYNRVKEVIGKYLKVLSIAVKDSSLHSLLL
jgi:hypothetical protein